MISGKLLFLDGFIKAGLTRTLQIQYLHTAYSFHALVAYECPQAHGSIESLPVFQSQRIRRTIAFLATASLGVAFTGCRQQVYHELYAEQNAREIRALEDRIYEYDDEYRALEYQLAVVSEVKRRAQTPIGRGSR